MDRNLTQARPSGHTQFLHMNRWLNSIRLSFLSSMDKNPRHSLSRIESGAFKIWLNPWMKNTGLPPSRISLISFPHSNFDITDVHFISPNVVPLARFELATCRVETGRSSTGLQRQYGVPGRTRTDIDQIRNLAPILWTTGTYAATAKASGSLAQAVMVSTVIFLSGP